MLSQTKILFMIVGFMAAIGWPQSPLSAADEKKEKRPPAVITDAQKTLVTSPAYQIYNTTMLECFKMAIGVDPVEAARKGDKKSLNMDRTKILKMQDCMKEKGVNADFENYYGGKRQNKNPAEMSAAQKADIDAIQAKLDASGVTGVPGMGTAPVPATIPAVMPVPAMPVSAVAPPPAVVPVPTPEKPEVKTDDSGTGAVKAPAQPRQYWVAPSK